MKFLTKLFKFICGILLLPFCAGAVLALWKVILVSGSADMIWITILAGALAFVLIYLFLAKPVWIYVFGHEMTHALWSWFFGGKLHQMRVTSGGGHVLITKANFITSLAPYFFPVYAVLIVVIYGLGNFFWDWSHYVLIFYFLLGMAYAFHITFTIHSLKIDQPDVLEQGSIFSAVIIFLGNILVLLVGIPLLSGKTNVSTAFHLWVDNSMQIYNYIINLF
ncbi:MAG: hypothetical protein V4439_01260 [Patescibacteria group bacterium]